MYTNRGVFECFNIWQTSRKKKTWSAKPLWFWSIPSMGSEASQASTCLHGDLHPTCPEPPDCTIGLHRDFLTCLKSIQAAGSRPPQRLFRGSTLPQTGSGFVWGPSSYLSRASWLDQASTRVPPQSAAMSPMGTPVSSWTRRPNRKQIADICWKKNIIIIVFPATVRLLSQLIEVCL